MAQFKRWFIWLCGLVAIFGGNALVEGAPFIVDAKSNLFYASLGPPGQPIGDGKGLYPGYIPLPPDLQGYGYRITFWSGAWSYMPDYPPAQNLPIEGLVQDAGPLNGTDLDGLNNILGIRHANKAMFLAGVFLGPTLPDTPPPRLEFDQSTDDFLVLAPLLGQSFFIGDGKTDDGALQQFVVPEGAVALYLGVADGIDFRGTPATYDDNSGSMYIEYDFIEPVPEPATFGLTAAGLVAACLLRRRR